MTATAITGLPGGPQQPVYVTVNITNPEKKADEPKKKADEGYLPGKKLYILLNAAISASIGLAKVEVNGVPQQIYYATYLTSLAAGTALGLYNSRMGKPAGSLNEMANQFAKSGFSDKLMILTEKVIGPGPLAMWIGNHLSQVEDLSLGSMVAGYWGFQTGVELGEFAHKKLFAAKAEAKEQ